MGKKNALGALALLAGAAFAQEPVTTCDWNNPGVNPYQGSLALAVLGYTEIPIWTRVVLASRVGRVPPTDYAVITRGGIESLNGHSYSDTLTGMHFGNGRKCSLPDRRQWSPTRRELSPVWCYEGECVTVPNICRNVSRIFRKLQEWNPLEILRRQTTPFSAGAPSTAALTGLALLALVFCTRRGR